MSTISYRANTLSQHFPFLSVHHGRTIIVPKQDQAFAYRANVIQNPSDDDREIGIPQAYYMHNVMPSSEGLQSVGFLPVIAGLPGIHDFEEIYTLRDINENKFLYSPSNGKNYVFDGNIGIWSPIPLTSISAPTIPAFNIVTVAYINGHTYICYKRTGLFEYNSATKIFDPVIITGVVAANLNGISASNGFLIAWDDFNVYRSSGLNSLDFTPDITSGAGFNIPNDIKGKILICLPLPSGFIIYTSANAIGAVFTQNIRQPFQYTEIAGSAGLTPPQQISWQYNGNYHLIWTRGGLQRVDKSASMPIYTDVTDFLSERIFEDYDDINDVFQLTNLTSNLLVRLNIIEKRFFVISYGITQFTHALVYDLFFKRWGKIKINHVAAFELSAITVYGDLSWDQLQNLSWDNLGDTVWSDLATQVLPAEHVKETLAFLQADGTIKTVIFDQTQTQENAVCVLGRYQYVRDRLLNINEIEIDCIQETANFTLKILPSIDGSNFLPAVTPTLVKNSGKFRKYQCDVWGKNHSLVAKGTFYLSSLELTMNPGGRA